MEKNKQEKNTDVITFEDLQNFIEPIQMNINIPYMEMFNIFKNTRTSGEVTSKCGWFVSDIFGSTGIVINSINKEFDELLELLPTLKIFIKNHPIYPFTSITYTSHIDGYDFRINPIDVLNSIFEYLAIDLEVPYINLDTSYGKEYFKNYIDLCTSYIKENETFEFVKKIMNEINDNVDKLLDLYNVDINPMIKQYCNPNDMLFYLSYKSLDNLERTMDPIYIILPYQYKQYIFNKKNTSAPNEIAIIDKNKILNHETYLNEYSSCVPPCFFPKTTSIRVTDNEYYGNVSLKKTNRKGK